MNRLLWQKVGSASMGFRTWLSDGDDCSSRYIVVRVIAYRAAPSACAGFGVSRSRPLRSPAPTRPENAALRDLSRSHCGSRAKIVELPRAATSVGARRRAIKARRARRDLGAGASSAHRARAASCDAAEGPTRSRLNTARRRRGGRGGVRRATPRELRRRRGQPGRLLSNSRPRAVPREGPRRARAGAAHAAKIAKPRAACVALFQQLPSGRASTTLHRTAEGRRGELLQFSKTVPFGGRDPQREGMLPTRAERSTRY